MGEPETGHLLDHPVLKYFYNILKLHLKLINLGWPSIIQQSNILFYHWTLIVLQEFMHSTFAISNFILIKEQIVLRFYIKSL